MGRTVVGDGATVRCRVTLAPGASLGDGSKASDRSSVAGAIASGTLLGSRSNVPDAMIRAA